MLFRILTANNIRTENRGTSNCRLKLKTGLNSNHVPHFRVDPQIFFFSTVVCSSFDVFLYV